MIKFAAIKATPVETVDTRIVHAYDHTTCYTYYAEAYGWYLQAQPDKYEVEEGFLLDDGTFVDRTTALTIARKCKQLKSMYDYTDVLYSYMIDWTR